MANEDEILTKVTDVSFFEPTHRDGVCVSLEEWGARIFEPHDKHVLKDAKRGCEKQKNDSTVPSTLGRSFHSLQQTYPEAKY